jgi:hypothetical protein
MGKPTSKMRLCSAPRNLKKMQITTQVQLEPCSYANESKAKER